MQVYKVVYAVAARAIDNPTEVLKLKKEIEALAEELQLPQLAEFIRRAEEVNIEEHRVDMFERAPKCPPYAGWWALGEDSRERGWYMHQILSYYKTFGFDMDVRKELPDYLPAMLEFLAATADVEDLGRRELRKDFYRRFIKPWFDKFTHCLEKQKSPYAHLAKALTETFKKDLESH